MDFATSSSPAVQRQLDRLEKLSPGRDVLGLERIAALLARLGNPQRTLPPVLHVAGTNGKGSTCAFLRAAVEAAGLSAHVYTSPHLVRFNERIRVAGQLIDDDMLAPLLEEVLDGADAIGPSFFEATTAAAFLAFSRTPADACIVEVGLGGRLDATNVIERPAACSIAQLGLDHQAFLGDTAEQIAAEKAGIAKPGAPLVTFRYPDPIAARVRSVAEGAGGHWLPEGDSWSFQAEADRLVYRDADGIIEAPLPRLAGAHQAANAALAFAMLRHQRAVPVADHALRSSTQSARWPARLQRLGDGPLRRRLPAGAELWLDGGHNPAAAQAIAAFFAGQQVQLVLGMLANKDSETFIRILAPVTASLCAVPVPDHDHHPPHDLASIARAAGSEARTAPDVPSALRGMISNHSPVLVTGSLYLTGHVLSANNEHPA